MSNFITNSKTETLKKRITELITTSKELRFLVGFFYFSGIRELYDGLKNREDLEIKVLVGLNVDKYIHGLVECEIDSINLSDRVKAENFLMSLSKSINTNDFDNQSFYEQVKFFIGLIKKNKLIIRKTLKPNHAKVYIFKLKDELRAVKDSILITGSSNLTKAGLSTQEEFNVEISDYGTKEADDFFMELWKDAVKITEDQEIRAKLIDLVENRTLIAEVTPFEAFALILKNYIDSQAHKELKHSTIDLLIKNGYKPYKYQLDAVRQALAVIENYSGVIIADVVGLGKSVIASLVAKNLGKRGVIVCRPGLMGDEDKKDSGWQMYKEHFQLFNWEVRSSGKLEDVLTLVRQNKDFEVVIIDEAHNFRNQDTEDYELLSDICRNKIVILLTATPFNNSPSDIFSLLKLFIVPGKSKITLDDNLDDRFRNYKKTFQKLSFINKNHDSDNQENKEKAVIDYESLFGERNIDLAKVKERAKYLSERIRTVIEPVLIRRNRLDLKRDPEYSKEVYDLPELQNPQELFFALSKPQSKFYDSVINEYFGENGRFKGAIYRPYEYEVGRSAINEEDESRMEENRQRLIQKNLFEFMRRLLVKRFESSFGAFRQSLSNFYKITDTVQKFINRTNRYILDRTLLYKIADYDLDEIERELTDFANKLKETRAPNPRSDKVYEVDNFKLKDEFLDDIESDKSLFKEILKELEELDLVKHDPKAKSLGDEIKKIMSGNLKKGEPKRKVVVFSEYIDTTIDLEKKIEKYFPGKVLVVKGDLSSSKVNEILKNFDASYSDQENTYDILIATDKISEGFNLNRAGAIINYDIPWNPTRVIQRVGRINRISKKVFGELFLYNFFPTEQGADIVRSRQIASDKMFLIHNTLGEDAKIFDLSETPTPAKLYNKIMENPEEAEEESLQTKVRMDYFKIKERYPEVVNKINALPPRIKVAKAFNENSIILFIRKGLGFFIKGLLRDETEVKDFNLGEVYTFIECKVDEKALPLSSAFWEKYEQIRTHKEAFRGATSEQSVERKATNNLRFLLTSGHGGLDNFKEFLQVLLEDVLEYKTLSLFTLRRIANLKVNSEKDLEHAKRQLTNIRQNLGDDYLEKIKKELHLSASEIIIAVENIKQ